MKLFPNFMSIPFDYLLISWVTNYYVSNLGFLTCLSLNLAYKVQNFSEFFSKIPLRIPLDVLLCVQVF